MKRLLKYKKYFLAIAALMLAATALIVSMQPVIPSLISRQASFVIFYPGKNSEAQIDRKSLKFDNSAKILTYFAKLGGSKLTVTNQATPETFSDIPQYYDKVVEQLHPYASFDGSNGKVSLTRPPSSTNQQVAVVNTQGTLMFVRANHDLTNDQWRKFFNNLSTIK